MSKMKARQLKLSKKLQNLTLEKTDDQIVIRDKTGPITLNLHYDVCEFGFAPGDFLLPTREYKEEGLGIAIGVGKKNEANGDGHVLWVLHEFDEAINYWGDKRARDFKKMGFMRIPKEN